MLSINGFLTTLSVDAVTGVALITLLFMMLQSEHERCDRVRAGWREVRRATFLTTTALQVAQKQKNLPDAADCLASAQLALTDLYSTVLLHGKGRLREEYKEQLTAGIQTKNGMGMLPIFQKLDGKTEKKFDAWKLRIL